MVSKNRLSTIVTRTAVGPQQSIGFEYDSKGRRIGKKVWSNTTFAGTPVTELKFLYDGWNLVATLNSGFALQTTFIWGLDLSGSVQGAGGVGGLLEINDSVNGPHFPCYDGNGNVTALASAADGTVSAKYEYGPFGEVIRATGPMAKSNPIRFSTKYQDDETDVLYYGYRYYNASTGRWLSFDPLLELGSIAVRNGRSASVEGNDIPHALERRLDSYCFLHNSPPNDYDAHGLCGGGTADTDTCGPEVRTAVNHTLASITRAFWRAGEASQQKAATEMYNLNIFGSTSGTTAWDIVPLYEAGSLPGFWWAKTDCGFTRGTGACNLGVTFNGKCYYATAVNYSMWGRMNRLAQQAADLYGWWDHDFSLSTALLWADAYKHWIQSAPWNGVMVQEVNAFVTYGYTARFRPPPTLPCGGSQCSVTDRSFEWRWRGLNFDGPVQ